MKRRTLAGTCGVGVFVIAFVTVCIAFATPAWLVSDYRITGAKLDKLGLWTHCFRSLPDVNDDYQRRFFVGCRWVYDPFTTGYDEIRGFLIPGKHFVWNTFFFWLGFIISNNMIVVVERLLLLHTLETVRYQVQIYVRVFNHHSEYSLTKSFSDEARTNSPVFLNEFLLI